MIVPAGTVVDSHGSASARLMAESPCADGHGVATALTHDGGIDGERLTELMISYGVGVQVERTYRVVEIDEDFFT